MRIYLTGPVRIELGERLVEGAGFPGRQGRLLFAYLVAERDQAQPRDRIAELLWGDAPPRSWESALAAVVSNLRRLLGSVGLGRDALGQTGGCYRLLLPTDAWVDLEAAADAVERAEGWLRAGDPAGAYNWAGVATAVGRRAFLPGEEGPWVERRRAELRDVLLRGLDCFAEVFVWSGEAPLAIRAAGEAIALEPFRETGYQRLMRVHAALGNRAEALRVYQRCRRLLADELGVDPSPRTEAVYLEALRS
jgi:DNA-binding SARP family transcriptional activator